jgi:SAM-dependent methyltransferase
MSEFDAYTEDYESLLNRGLWVSGESQTYFSRGRVAWLSRRIHQLGFRPEKVLDYGCGTGTATPFLVELLGARSVTGVDVSERSLEVAREACTGLPAQFLTARDYVPDESIDLAYCNGVFHHIPPPDRLDAVRYIARCLRPGGLFALWENNPWNPGTQYIMSRIPFDRDAIKLSSFEARRLVTAAGLSVLRVDYTFFFPGPLDWLRPIEPRLSWCPFGAQYQVLCTRPAAPEPPTVTTSVMNEAAR